MRQNLRLRLLSYGVIVYMVMAFTWWAVLLFLKNRDAFRAKKDSVRIALIEKGQIQTEEEFLKTESYQTLWDHYRRQEWMIAGEAAVFMLSLGIGVWLINRGYHKEMLAAQQRRNFLLSITHELKSPIASIRLILETFQKRSLSNDQTQKLSQNAIKEAERLHKLVNDLLFSAQLETAYQPYPEEIDLSALIQELVKEQENRFPDARFYLHDELPPMPFTGDRPGLTSVVLNLLENAVKYSSAAPEIDIRLSRQREAVLIEVADHGVGIEEKEKKKIFEKFYRIGNEDTRRTKGTGLGLYIVDQIVKAHRGHIDVFDNPPRGTIFRIVLPVEAGRKETVKSKQIA